MTASQIRVTAVCFSMAFFAWGTVFYGHGFYLTALQDRHGWSTGLVSSAISVFWAAGIPAGVLAGRVLDASGPRPVALYGVLAIGTSLVLLGLVDSPWQLFAVYALMATGYPALATPAISAALIPWFERGYGLALSVALTGASVGGAVMVPLMVTLDRSHGFTVTVSSLGIALIALLVPLVLLGMRSPPRNASPATEPPEPASSVREKAGPQGRWLLRQRAFWGITIGSALGLGAQVGFLAHQLAVLQETLTPVVSALVVSAGVVAAAAGRLVVGVASRRVPPRYLSALSFVVQAAGIVVVASSHGLAGLLAGSILAGFFIGAIVLLPPLLIRDAFGDSSFGRVYGLTNVGLYLGASLGPAATGLIRDAVESYQSALLVLVGAHLAGAVVIVGFSRGAGTPAAGARASTRGRSG